MKPSETIRFYASTGLLWMGSCAWLVYNLYNSSSASICLFKNITSLPCPACGTTRSAVNIMQGHLLHAVYINPLGFLAIILLLAVPIWLVTDMLRHKQTLHHTYKAFDGFFKKHPAIIIIMLAALSFNWLWNIAKHL